MAALPEPWKSLRRAFEILSERVKKLENTSPFSGTGLSIPEPGVTQVDGNLWVTGDFTADGKINNDALVDPVNPNVVNQVATNFAVAGGGFVTIVSFNATVPTGCTRLLAHLTGDAFVVNPNTTGGSNGAGSDIIIAQCSAGADDGLAMGTSISGSNGQTSVHCSLAALQTGLTPGDTVTLRVKAYGAFQSFGAANPSNQANLCASLLWLR